MLGARYESRDMEVIIVLLKKRNLTATKIKSLTFLIKLFQLHFIYLLYLQRK